MGVATRADKLGGDAGRVERRRIRFPLVTYGIELAGHDDRGRESGDIGPQG